MKKSVLAIVVLGIGLTSLTSCGKSTSSSPAAKAVVSNEIKVATPETKNDTTANHNAQSINLRQAKEFVLFANTSITSMPNSTIKGKIGLRPGIRSLIKIDPSEIVGGITEVYAGDEKIEANSIFVTKSKMDIINAYNEAETRAPDADKINLWKGNIGNKVLAAGVYEFKSSVTIPLDLKLEGNETDVWIFKIAGQLRVGSDVHVTLSGGAKASNVFWQVGDDALLKTKCAMVGTIISQQTIEMKDQASLVGRAFSKNDKILLDKNTITIP